MRPQPNPEPTNHCAVCANRDTALCVPCIREAAPRPLGGLLHFVRVEALKKAA